MERRRRFPPFGACDYWGDRRIKKEEEDILKPSDICLWEQIVIDHRFSTYAPPNIKYRFFIDGNASVYLTNEGMIMEVDGGIAGLIWEGNILMNEHGYSSYFGAWVKQYDKLDDEQVYMIVEEEYKKVKHYFVVLLNSAEKGTVVWDVINNRLICNYKKGCITPPPPEYIIFDSISTRLIAAVKGYTRCYDKKINISKIAVVTVDMESGDGIYKVLFDELGVKRLVTIYELE
ncbi:MAG: hypothetical protein QW607_11190 [Desulfurococcaceae archaeon]